MARMNPLRPPDLFKIHIAAASVALLATAACVAAEPPASTPISSATARAADSSSSAQTPGSTNPPVQTPAVSADETQDSAAIAKSAHDLGYTKKLLNGKTVYYCKADASIGTRLSTNKCYTEQQMSGVIARSAANRDSVAEMERKRMNQPSGQ